MMRTHPIRLFAHEEGNRRHAGRDYAPRSVRSLLTAIAILVREEADWMRPHHPGAEDSATSFLSPVAQELLELMKQRGALFFPDMVRATERLKAEVETGRREPTSV